MIIVWFALFSSSLPIAHHDKEDGGDIVPKIWIMERKNKIMFIDSCQWFSSKGWNWLGSSPRPRLLMLTIGCRCRCASWQRRWRRRQGGGRTHRAWSGPGRGREPEEVLFMDISKARMPSRALTLSSGLLYSNIKAQPSTDQVLLLSC